MSREDPQLKVRLPQELKDQITESARLYNRSMNAEIVARLQMSFEQPEGEATLGSRMLSNAVGEMIEQSLSRITDRLIQSGIPQDAVLKALKTETD
ncbi:hypothetical protein F993_01473 [Acinetobacter proteolyticus]|uniref:Arc-like DNA binding domain-containing protein n=1 Tax=Acinetobacter proteolyticus TaxID=1776741 RepID=A0ABP2TP31_9GAMM|nr:Arc family DNA-binding protein [Acinetobacter proteolyticus]ENU24157.1 hypothetical protein F993_01473 [Acinetobacter proteolyticus]